MVAIKAKVIYRFDDRVLKRFFDEQHDIAIINFTVSYIKNQNESTNSLIHSQLNTNGKVKVINGK